MLAKALITLTLAALSTAHAVIKTPTPRTAGPTHTSLCGSPVASKLASDPAGPIESAVAKADASYKCDAYLCRGYQWGDNTGRAQSYVAGQVVPFYVDLVAAHKPGWANVSVIDLQTNKAVGTPLKTWSVWPDDVSGGGDDVDFNVTIPGTLGSACNVGGKCALQWYWWSSSNKQTYEGCVDFYVK
ncbi:uncharacterized protein CC84DRAFT_1218647 [Paraphaeosphaeria sporulosa]|uniref:Chitin-binding type-4 domain-containing protein n=1 Tax=Paraphaeosphaeria sporulosa TaxID=1460663 RepID=A0A177CEV1_9PLEO|nr:uncharacterized protein CC84DRAFT_1218647 [Paraphaeosphaeria sporulosa]OAG05287.1 hypothetical protein CC84DRAFT_1218647 [Paraphaeosphaeria sporulosa]